MSEARALLLVVLAALGLAAAAPAAPAWAETRSEVRDLARQAASDPGALERLRQVRTVEGRPADFRAALEGAEGDELRRRLDVIESENADAARAGPAAETARDDARRILDSSRYRVDDEEDTPRPLRGVLRQLGEWLSPVLEPVGRFLRSIGRRLGDPTDDVPVLLLLIAAVVAVTVLLTRAAVRRRTRIAEASRGGAAAPERERNDPRALEREADAAEAAGDYERALRLRFRAGLLKLDKAGVIELRPSATTGQLVRTIPSATFPRLARTFDEVAYGGRTPGAEEVQRAKSEWPRVLDEAKR